MKNLTQETARQIVAKATQTFGGRFGKALSDFIGVPQPYVSKLKKFSDTGHVGDMPPFKSVDKFVSFLNSGGVAPVHKVSTGGHDLIISLRDRQTNKFVSGIKTSEEDLRNHFNGVEPIEEKSDKEILDDIQLRFDMAFKSVSSIFNGKQSAVIISGPAGCGKSYNVEKKIQEEVRTKNAEFKSTHLKGATMSYTGLYKLLWDHRDGGVIVFDDSDKLWDDEDMMNTLKSAMDTSKNRYISTASGGRWVRDLAEEAGVEDDEVRKFEFKGKIIFITNKDINGLVERQKRGFEHFSALIDRSFYIDLEMFSLRAKYLWCEHVFMNHIAPQMGLSEELTLEILEFVSDNRDKLRDVSVRGIEVIANVASDEVYRHSWKKFIEVTRFKRSK